MSTYVSQNTIVKMKELYPEYQTIDSINFSFYGSAANLASYGYDNRILTINGYYSVYFSEDKGQTSTYKIVASNQTGGFNPKILAE